MSKHERYSRSIFTTFIEETHLEDIKGVVICGSYRRETPDNSDLDLIINNQIIKDKEEFTEILRERCKIDKSYIQIKGIREVRSGEKHTQLIVSTIIYDKPYDIQLDCKFVNSEEMAAAMLHFTGSVYLNIAMRSIAKKKGYILNEYGLWINGNEKFPYTAEQQFFSALGFSYIEPELRTCIDVPSAFQLLKMSKI